MVRINDIKERIIAGGNLTQEEAIILAQCDDKEALYDAADQIREHFVGRKLDMCSITNAKSGLCEQDCKWCSQSAHHSTDVRPYELIDGKEALKIAKENAAHGVNRYSLVTSGRALSKMNVEKLCFVYKNIKKETDIHLCASMGLLDKESLLKLKDAGVEHYHCNIETAPSHFANLVTTHTMEEKIETIKMAQEIGMGVCSGGIIGMGENMEQRIEMAYILNELGVISIPLNILNPIEGTPLEGTEKLTDEEILTTIALFRFINPKAHIRFAGGRNLISHIQEKALHSGISAALVGDYLTTIGTNVTEDKAMFTKAGFEVGN